MMLWCWLVSYPLGAAEPLTMIHAGQLPAIPGQDPLAEQSVVIEGGEITRVMPGFADAAKLGRPDAEVRVLDLSNQFVLPGLIDLHVHITMESKPDEHLRVVTESDADLALTGAQHAKTTLEAGFTTIVDLGRPGTPGHEVAAFALRDPINEGKVPGPRILATGSPISATSQSRRPLFRNEVEQGKRADIVATTGNPLQDISAMTRVTFVMRDGVVYRNQGL